MVSSFYYTKGLIGTILMFTFSFSTIHSQSFLDYRQYINRGYNEVVLPKAESKSDEPAIEYAESIEDFFPTDTVYLPVVFHVVLPAGAPTVTETQALEQVAALNKHFSKEEFYEKTAAHLPPLIAGKIGGRIYDGYAVDTHIRFCFKSMTFTTTDTLLFNGYQSIKSNTTGGKNPEFVDNTINVWVGKFGIGHGFAQMPNMNQTTDGIVIDAKYFGLNPTMDPYHEGKTLTHLMGNYLGLFDLWGLYFCEDDWIDDTPVHNAPNLEYDPVYAIYHTSGCPSVGRKKYEMLQNFMDCTLDSAMYMFTRGQMARMRAHIRTYRAGLVNQGCEQIIAQTVADEDDLVYDKTIKNSTAVIYSQPFEVKLYPNPVSENLTLLIQNPNVNTKTTINIRNIMGQTVETISTKLVVGTNTETLEVSYLTIGTYFLTVKNDKHKKTIKFSKL